MIRSLIKNLSYFYIFLKISAIIYTFNVNSPRKIEDVAKKFRVPIHSYKVIYKLIDDIKNEICKKLPPDHVEEKIGKNSFITYYLL